MDRGFTGHEHLREFTLINMNARMYDPEVGRMLAVDNFIANPNSSQDYNRYTYANNNPLMYADPSGEIAVAAAVVIGAIVGAYLGGASANSTFNIAKWENNATTWIGIGTGVLMGGLSGGLAAAGQLSISAGVTVAGVTIGQVAMTPSSTSYDLSVSSGNKSVNVASWDKSSYKKMVGDAENAEYMGGWDYIMSSPKTQQLFLEHVGRYWSITTNLEGKTTEYRGYSFLEAYREYVLNLGVNSNIATGLVGYDVNAGAMYSRREGLQLYFDVGYSVGGMLNPISLNVGKYKSQRTNGHLSYSDIRGYGTSNNYSIWFAGFTEGGSASRQEMQFPPPTFSSSPYNYRGFSISDPYSKLVVPFGFSRSYTHTWISRF